MSWQPIETLNPSNWLYGHDYCETEVIFYDEHGSFTGVIMAGQTVDKWVTFDAGSRIPIGYMPLPPPPDIPR